MENVIITLISCAIFLGCIELLMLIFLIVKKLFYIKPSENKFLIEDAIDTYSYASNINYKLIAQNDIKKSSYLIDKKPMYYNCIYYQPISASENNFDFSSEYLIKYNDTMYSNHCVA